MEESAIEQRLSIVEASKLGHILIEASKIGAREGSPNWYGCIRDYSHYAPSSMNNLLYHIYSSCYYNYYFASMRLAQAPV